jgi:hypothetical protein
VKAYFRIALPLLALIAGGGARAATEGSPAGASTVPVEYPSQPIQLSTDQERFIWQRVRDQPVDFSAASRLPVPPGQVLPNDVPLQPLPDDVATQVPSLQGYQYAILQDRLLLVNPSNKTVGHVIDINQRSIR